MTGKTTQQLIDAPIDAYYVWPVQLSISYVEALAKDLGRTDLCFLALSSVLKLPGSKGYNQRRPIVVDHACWPTEEQQEIIDLIRQRYSSDARRS